MSFAYLPLYTGDYLRDTADLTVAEHGIYLLLLMHSWDTRGPIPPDEARAARIVGASSDDERNMVKFILTTYFVRHDDGWYNPRLDREIARCNAISGARSEAGKLGASKTWDKMAIAKANAMANAEQLPRHVPLSPSPSPSPSKARSKTPSQPSAAPDGVRPEVWEAWCRERGKKMTPDSIRLQEKKLASLSRDGNDPNDVIEQSIANSWTGLFPVGKAKHQSNQSKRAAVAAAIFKTQEETNAEPTDITGQSKRVA